MITELSELPAQLKRLQLLTASQKSGETVDSLVHVSSPLGSIVNGSEDEMDVLNMLPECHRWGQLHTVFEIFVQDGFGIEVTILVQELISDFAIDLLASS